ncbi:proliferating cell nuclear antigen (pcna) [Candidatus Woesearchaeota archaeon]|nr:proliferating cell nuclear antigen (pcna) [Candidatus Woesearchaeota archaeon]
MKLTLTDPSYLKDSVAVISELVNEARFKITKNSIELIAMDPANIAMVIYKLLASCFSEYQLEKDVEVSIDLNNFKQILRRAKPSDQLTLAVEDDNQLHITLKGASTRTFSLPIIEMEGREQRVPELEFPVKIKTNCSALVDAIEDASIVAESVAFIAEPGKFVIKAHGDLSKATVEIPSSPETSIVTPGSVRAKYSIEYLKKMMSASKLSEQVEIGFNQDYPLRIDYKVVDRVLLAFILAPRVEND